MKPVLKKEEEREGGERGGGERERERGGSTHSLKVSTGLLLAAHHVDYHWQSYGPQLSRFEERYLEVWANQTGNEVGFLLSEPMPHYNDVFTEFHALVAKPGECMHVQCVYESTT